MKALWRISAISAALAVCGTASAAEIPYSVSVGANEKLTGVVNLDDSSGDPASASGVASGAVTGKFDLDSNNTHTEINGATFKLNITFERRSERLTARLDTCPVSPDNCDAGTLVVLWEK